MTDSAYSREYGSRLRAARVMAGLTQDEAATKLGLTRSSVANIEAGRQNATAEQVIQTAQALGCDPRWLLTGWEPGHAFQGAAVARNALTSHVRSLRELADRLEHALPGFAPADTSADSGPSALPCASNPTQETR